MSISGSLNNALSGLNVTSRKAEVVSNNIANALTEGYGRRELETASTLGGVRVVSITRNVDPGLTSDRRIAEATLNADQRTADMLGKVEALLGTPDDSDSISARLSAFESALVFAASDPSSDQRLSQINSTMTSLFDKMKSSTTQIQALRQEADLDIKDDILALNRNLKMVEELNADITRAKSVGQDTSSMLDARQQIVDDISAIVPVRELDRGGDQLALITTSGMILIDGKAAEFEFSNTPTIVADMTLSSGGLSGITRNGVPLNGSGGFGKLSGGSLEAAFAARDNILVQSQSGLDEFAYDLAMRFQNTTTEPTLVSNGAITDSGGLVESMNIDGLAGRLVLNSVFDPKSGGVLSAWRDGVGVATAGPTGNSVQISRYINALSSEGGANGSSAADAMSQLSSRFSQERLNSEMKLSFSAARWDNLHNAELAGGVDTDVELQNLLRVEHAYAANAKVIQTISAMIQKIMEI